MNNAIKREQLSLFKLPSVSILREAKRILLIQGRGLFCALRSKGCH